MTSRPSRTPADQQWIEAMFADLQRQIDQLTGDLLALTNLVHAHTLAALNGEPHTGAHPDQQPAADDGR
ncbi:hypothetical protein GCM10011608_59700 [Micromonospora sonchi]|uniref:Uncharacterized protein n=1 Tax=Micromonospora sonchi TaxID=1763543 RepID=A0A917UAF7_9ACTN|nr:hypothetical protein [Micromonospora sonchi]GGM66512.1 hypothetical protein GCM10011608_59700 [Micromonospora sonchi]